MQMLININMSYGEVLGWIKARLSFAIVRAADLCLRESHVHWISSTGSY